MQRQSAIEIIGADAAFRRARKNDLRKYPTPEKDGDRLYPLAAPSVAPTFEIGRQDTIYAIGSCFARNVERALEAAGQRVLSREFDLGEIGASLDDATNFFNKYSIHSVLNDVRWALERDTFPGEDLLYRIGPDQYIDAQLGMARLDFPAETILAFRHRYLDAMAALADADVVILTLGYVETWYDRQLGLYLNLAPPLQMIKAAPDRFEFRVLSYADVLDGLNQLYALLTKHRTKPLKMLVTVSPVPLLITFRDMDILVANTYSKSVQRAAIEEFLIGKTGVDYFPSYETVTLSNPTVAWKKVDYRHVSDQVVDLIMQNVLTRYVSATDAEAATMSRDALLASCKALLKLEKYQEAVDLIAQNRAVADADAEVLLIEALATKRLERLDLSFDALGKAREIAPTRPDALERMILLCRPMRRRSEARELLSQHAAAFPERADFRDKVTWV